MSIHHLNARTEVQIADDQLLLSFFCLFENFIASCIWVDRIAEELV